MERGLLQTSTLDDGRIKLFHVHRENSSVTVELGKNLYSALAIYFIRLNNTVTLRAMVPLDDPVN